MWHCHKLTINETHTKDVTIDIFLKRDDSGRYQYRWSQDQKSPLRVLRSFMSKWWLSDHLSSSIRTRSTPLIMMASTYNSRGVTPSSAGWRKQVESLGIEECELWNCSTEFGTPSQRGSFEAIKGLAFCKDDRWYEVGDNTSV